MKIKGIILFLILLSFTVKAQMIDESKVPPAIVKHLNDKYKITGSVDWEKDKDLINAQFYVGDFKGYAYYKANGSYDSSYVEVDPIVLPDAVSQYIKENFKGLKIQYARKHEYADSKNNYFYITTPKDQNKKRYIPEFAIKPNGTLIYEVFPQDLASLRVKEAAQPKEQPKKKEPAKTVKKDPVQKEQVKNEDLQDKDASKKETPKKEDPKAQKQDKPGAQKTDVSSSSIPKPVL
ncbi:MAG: hypothetical protein KA792_09105, partial [Bacteroidales bacterium]|nr:hypothetical protein [Bacteroidales bacterium]